MSLRPYLAGPELPSVPDAYAEYAYWRDALYRCPSFAEYSLARAYWQAREAWIDAEWQVNCASWRWVRLPTHLIDEDVHWRARRELHRLRWVYQLPTKALAIRDEGVVV